MMGYAPWAVAEDDEDEGFTFEEKLQSCAACHGENGDKPLAPEYPILAGQYADYLTQALRQYATGRRTNPIMMQQVELLELTETFSREIELDSRNLNDRISCFVKTRRF